MSHERNQDGRVPAPEVQSDQGLTVQQSTSIVRLLERSPSLSSHEGQFRVSDAIAEAIKRSEEEKRERKERREERKAKRQRIKTPSYWGV